MRILPGCAQKNIFGKTKQTNQPITKTQNKRKIKKQKHTKQNTETFGRVKKRMTIF